MTRDDLQTRVEAYLHRTDLSADIPGFIELATKRLGRDLRSTWNTQYAVYTVSSDPYILPVEFKSMRNIAAKLSRGPVSLRSVGVHELNKYSNGGEPLVYAIRGRDLSIRPYQSGEYELEFFEEPPALTLGTSTNDVLTELPYLYIYATLYEAYVFLQDEDLASAMATIYRGEVDAVNAQESRALSGDAPAMRAI